VIRAPFDNPDVLARLRPAWQAARSLILPGAASGSIKARFKRYYVANRGRYEVATGRNSKQLQAFTEALTGARLEFEWLRVYRFGHRDYSLFFDDAQTRVTAGVEVTIDLSNEMIGPPAIYENPRVEVPQSPGLVAVVERGPGTFRYDRYFPASVGRKKVVRLRAAYRFRRLTGDSASGS
jgi:hypothetical protein